MGIEYFEPRPPTVSAMQLSDAESVGDRMEKLSCFPGIKKVTVTRDGGEIRFTIHPFDGCGEPITIQDSWFHGRWLIAVATETDEWPCQRRTEVKLITADALQRVYRPVDPGHASDASAREAGQRWGKEIRQGLSESGRDEL